MAATCSRDFVEVVTSEVRNSLEAELKQTAVLKLERVSFGIIAHTASSSLVLLMGLLKRDCAHVRASAHRYSGRKPNR
jgi:hypothetical protein